VLGLGAIGGDTAAKLASLGFQVAGWSRTPKALEGIESFHGEAGFLPFLQRTDILVCLLPLTPETTGVLDARAFAALPAGAYVINLARGGHVVEEDLLAAIDGGHLAGATLDVFQTEPLPNGHPFWAHPKVHVTPHIAGLTNPRTSAAQVIENIRRVRAGQPPLNLVDAARGY
jgi:glyoxylate/hydroxypyruvate reductase A